jgi:hypothetical protein
LPHGNSTTTTTIITTTTTITTTTIIITTTTTITTVKIIMDYTRITSPNQIKVSPACLLKKGTEINLKINSK